MVGGHHTCMPTQVTQHTWRMTFFFCLTELAESFVFLLGASAHNRHVSAHRHADLMDEVEVEDDDKVEEDEIEEVAQEEGMQTRETGGGSQLQ